MDTETEQIAQKVVTGGNSAKDIIRLSMEIGSVRRLGLLIGAYLYLPDAHFTISLISQPSLFQGVPGK